MDNNKHTAKFLASFFLNSKQSLKYKLNSVDREIIRYLCDCIDMNFSKSGTSEIKMTFKQLSLYTGSSDKTVRRRIPRLIELQIIRCNEISNGQSYTFYIGKFLVDLGHNDLPPRSKDKVKAQNLGHSDLHLIKASNNYSKQIYASRSKNQDQKLSPLVNVENQSTSYQKMEYERKPMSDEHRKAWEESKRKCK